MFKTYTESFLNTESTATDYGPLFPVAIVSLVAVAALASAAAFVGRSRSRGSSGEIGPAPEDGLTPDWVREIGGY